METEAIYEKYAEQIQPVETKELYESFLLLALELEEDSIAEHLKDLDAIKVRVEISRIAAASVLPQFVDTLGSKEKANFVYVRAYGVIIYLYALKGEAFLSFANSLPEYIFDICADSEMCWKGQGDYGFFEFDQIRMQKRIDEEAGIENADPLSE